MRAEDIVIVSAARTPIGRLQGGLSAMSAPELGARAVAAAVARAGVDGALVDEVILGNVIGAGLGQAPARQAALGAGLPQEVGGFTVNKVCGSGLKAVMLAAALLRAGEARVLVAGGMESMTNGPYLLPRARQGYRFGNAELLDATLHDGLWCAFEHHAMGNSAEWIAQAQDVSREAQDEWALRSHQRAAAAQDAGYFAAELVPVTVSGGKQQLVVDTDEPVRRDTSLAQLAKLRPAFQEGGSVTAGNAPGITDGAAALVLMSVGTAQELGLTPLARLIGAAQAGVKPLEIFTAPVFAIQQLFARTNTTAVDYARFEINEAFASQVVANSRALNLDEALVNPDGGAIALGHPIGASGARVLTTLVHGLRRAGGGRGLAALCLGGGEAVALAVETVG